MYIYIIYIYRSVYLFNYENFVALCPDLGMHIYIYIYVCSFDLSVHLMM